MNKIFKKIWSESRGCFVVVSETASSISRSKGKVTSLILVTFLAASNVFALTTHNGNVELGTLRDGEKRTLVDSFVINGNATANTPELYISWTSKNFRGMENQSLLVNGNLDSSSPLFVIVHKGISFSIPALPAMLKRGKFRQHGLLPDFSKDRASLFARGQKLIRINFSASSCPQFSGSLRPVSETSAHREKMRTTLSSQSSYPQFWQAELWITTEDVRLTTAKAGSHLDIKCIHLIP